MRNKKALLLAAALILTGCQTADSSIANSSSNACADDGAFGCEVSTKTEEEAMLDDFEAISFEQAIQFFENKESGLLYFGFPDCPWCKEVVPILHDEALDSDVPVYYIRTRDDDRNLLYTEEQREEIAPYLGEFVQEGADGQLKLYVPLVVSVKDGQLISGHQGTVEEHDAHERVMTEEEKKQVEKDLQEIVDQAAQAV